MCEFVYVDVFGRTSAHVEPRLADARPQFLGDCLLRVACRLSFKAKHKNNEQERCDREQCCGCSRNIAQVTLKIVYFYYMYSIKVSKKKLI